MTQCVAVVLACESGIGYTVRMRAPMMLSLDADNILYIRQLAAELGVTNSDLVELWIALGKRHPKETYEKWAQGKRQAAAAGHSGYVVLKGSEQRALAELTTEWTEYKAHELGRVKWRALNGLLARGLVECHVINPYVYPGTGAWGFSKWRRKA